ncbi:hypothetical protein F3Y22_tig00000778pilonHSYRG00074 [Hibiscus syriacus]|uniref:TFIIS central domain-containing protein n=1 Tax=Hibiscus syriacus TaxID=106335 RepID=A0A6A3D0A8_HIBSY|nr:hypothetical protein F3Y22_tig00000778pilonHSYRG00074 [Hibiscus syriacus]
MERELVDLFEAASKAADLAASNANGPKFVIFPITFCLFLLFHFTKVGKRLRLLTKHPRERINTVASKLLEMWKKLVLEEIAVRKKNGTFPIHKTSKAIPTKPIKLEEKKATTMADKNKINIEQISNAKSGPKLNPLIKTYDPYRNQIRMIFLEAFSKVAGETDDEEVLDRVNGCDPIQAAISVETAMFMKLGKTYGTQQHKYSEIMSNMTDPNNPELRRKVLLGEIMPGKLISMTPVFRSLW